MNAPDDCIIEAGTIVCGSDAAGDMQLRYDSAMRIHNGKIAHIGPIEAVGFGNADLKRFGGRDMVAMPGLVNSHHHFGLTPLMMGVPFAPLELWLPQFRAMRQVGPRLDTLYSAIEMLESGTTTVHHINSGLVGTPDNWKQTTDAILDAYGEIGMRCGYSFMMRDRNVLTYEDDEKVLQSLPPGIANWLAPRLSAAATPTHDYMTFFAETKRNREANATDKVRVHLAPANLHWCSDDSLQLIFETAKNHGSNIHMHLLETERQAAFAQSRYGHSAVQHLAKLQCLGPALTLGHGNWMTGEDLDIVAECGCMICHNASSGLRLGSGIAPVNEMRRRNIKVALGIDQSNIADDRDMLLEMNLAWALHRETGLWNDRPSAVEIIQMATEHGARSVGFSQSIGRLEPGRQADIILMPRSAIERPYVDPRTPIADTLLHRATKSAIDKVFVDGKLVVDRGRVTQIDREAVMAEITARLKRPYTADEAEAVDMVNALMPHLQSLQTQQTINSTSPYRYNAMGG